LPALFNGVKKIKSPSPPVSLFQSPLASLPTPHDPTVARIPTRRQAAGGRWLPARAATRSGRGRREVALPPTGSAAIGVAHEVEEEHRRKEAGSGLRTTRSGLHRPHPLDPRGEATTEREGRHRCCPRLGGGGAPPRGGRIRPPRHRIRPPWPAPAGSTRGGES
jgi:hypothetical protein